jgi:hypothetical protein
MLLIDPLCTNNERACRHSQRLKSHLMSLTQLFQVLSFGHLHTIPRVMKVFCSEKVSGVNE